MNRKLKINKILSRLAFFKKYADNKKIATEYFDAADLYTNAKLPKISLG